MQSRATSANIKTLTGFFMGLAFCDFYLIQISGVDNAYIFTIISLFLVGLFYLKKGVSSYWLAFAASLVLLNATFNIFIPEFQIRSFIYALIFAAILIFYSTVGVRELKTAVQVASLATITIGAALALAFYGPMGSPIGARLFAFNVEPSHLCALLVPSTAYFIARRQVAASLLGAILIALTQSASVVAPLGALIIYFVVSSRISNRLKVLYSIGAMAALYVFYVYVEAINFRLNDLWFALTGPFRWDQINLTTFSIMSNLQVTKAVFIENYGVGLGFFNTEVGFEKFNILRYSGAADVLYERQTNWNSGHSLAIRILNEFGIIGLGFLAWLGYRCLTYRNLSGDRVEFAVFVFLFTALAFRISKLGSYFDLGVPIILVGLVLLCRPRQEQGSLKEMRRMRANGGRVFAR